MLYIKIKIFKRPNISIISKYLNFCTKISPFSFFAHIVWLKSAVISLYYQFKKKTPKMFNITRTKLFRWPNILIRSIYIHFFTKISPFSIFGLSIFEKRLLECSTSQSKNFLGEPIFWLCPYKSIFLPAHFHFFGHPVWLK